MVSDDTPRYWKWMGIAFAILTPIGIFLVVVLSEDVEWPLGTVVLAVLSGAPVGWFLGVALAFALGIAHAVLWVTPREVLRAWFRKRVERALMELAEGGRVGGIRFKDWERAFARLDEEPPSV